ncbi:unnamed protein product [Macrosiphum euphorbiae]|uniref:Uncharacterized protein n=1 Tax=Macrosiphum euphorbiae TaxID=13131 RepID=A0AAV0WGE2_9HEMI|nr:unnamed protein product [Macrosiphum euphorbiae]
MAAIIVASLLWLPSADCIGRTTTVDAGSAEVESATESATETAASVATRRTSPAGQFSVNMILPFSKSTIRYSYTEPTALASSVRIPVQTMDVDQAHSMSVSPYGCDTANNSRGSGGQRKRKRARWKTTAALPAAADDEQSDSVVTRMQTNTVVPLPGYPTAQSGQGVVFEAAAEQLDQLYTVSRLASTVSGIGDNAEASGEGGTTDAAEDSTVK